MRKMQAASVLDLARMAAALHDAGHRTRV